MKGIKKILALVLVAMMAMGMVSALADTVGGDNQGAETGVLEIASDGTSATMTISKVVLIENVDGANASGLVVATPAMTFTYGIAPATVADGTTVTDKTTDHNDGVAVTAEVKPGIENGVTLTNNGAVSIAATENTTLNQNGQAIVKGNLTLTVTASDYNASGAGIYRYEIKDLTKNISGNDLAYAFDSSTLAVAGQDLTHGVIRGKAVPSYFLDVYIKNVADAAPATTTHLEVGGFVLTTSNTSITASGEGKKSGFDEVTLNSDGTLDPTTAAVDTNNDYYKTWNVTLSKVVDGAMGDKTHGFPFIATVNNDDLKYEVEVTGNATASNDVERTTTPGTLANFKLGNGATLKIWGLSPLATVKYMETNDTDSVYKLKVENGNPTDVTTNVTFSADSTANALKTNGTATLYNSEAAAITDYTTKSNKNETAISATAKATTYTNTLDQISPTGLVLRFAPYFAMFAAGVALFIILGIKRRKSEEE